MGDVLDEWNIALFKLHMEQSKVRSIIPSSRLWFKKVAIRRDIARKIKDVKAQLDIILAEKDRYGLLTSQPTDPSRESWRVQSTSLIDFEEVEGRDIDRDVLVSKVLMIMPQGGGHARIDIQIVSIVGVGGIGKTTLAQLVYNDSRVKECFELRIWICVSDPFDVAGIAKGIIERVDGNSPNTNQLEVLVQRLKECVSGKKFLLVMDDVWTEDSAKWEPLKNSLKCGGTGSKVLVTTRNERVAKTIGGAFENEIYHLGQLSDETCWLLLQRIALFGRNKEEWGKFQDIGKRIANKCKGLPLGAKALGSLLRFKNGFEDWENVLCSEIWELVEAEVDLFPHLLLSYNELCPALKRCFSYCAIFPKDSKIYVDDVIGHWMALGYLGSDGNDGGDMELKGQQYFNNLAMRSLFQDLEKDNFNEQIKLFKMHDLVHDFAQFIRKNGRVEAGMKKKSCQACSPLTTSHAEEYRSLFCDRDSHICDCLKSLRVLSLRELGLQSVPREVEKFIHLRWLDLSDNNLSVQDLETICKLYNLQTLLLAYCNLKEIPSEIGNLIHLRHLDLSKNVLVRKLPESICDLHELRTLDIEFCPNIFRLPEGIGRLINLKHIYNDGAISLKTFPQGLDQLTCLRTLSDFWVGASFSKLGWLKNLDRLSGSLQLNIVTSSENIVEDAREGDLRKKEHIRELKIEFYKEIVHDEIVRVEDWQLYLLDVIDALEPHPNLRNLQIGYYTGSKLPDWIASPLNQLRCIHLYRFSQEPSLSLPPLGKLPCLEEIEIKFMHGLQFVGREFLGTTTKRTGATDIEETTVFPKLKKLTFEECLDWKEWEDITAGGEYSTGISLMPCLSELIIRNCINLAELPHRLLLIVAASSSLKTLDISGSAQLRQRYRDKEDSPWKLISSINPCIQLIEF